MNTFPNLPGWDGIHPAMVQFPIVLLFVAPLFLLVSLFSPRAWRTWAGASLLLMTLGAFTAWLAVATGHAGGQLVDKTPALEQAIARHEALGILTRNVFTALAAVFAVLMLLSAAIKKPLPGAARISLHALFVVVYIGCTLAIVNTAARGGFLVHKMGVQAMIEQAGPQGTVATSASHSMPTARGPER
jgi:uncharacterized membrane protein